MCRLTQLIFLLQAVLIQPTFAYTPKEGKVSTIIGPFTSKTNFQVADSVVKAPQMGGFGMIALGDTGDKGSLEIGLFHMHKTYLRKTGDRALAESVETAHITMGYRWWWTEVFSGSVTFFSAYPMGDTEVIHRRVPANTPFDTSAADLTEYGLDFSIQTELGSWPRFALILDTRYSLSLTAKEHEYADHFGVMLGLRFPVQE